MMSYFDHRIQEHIVESADGEYVLGREKLFTETTSDRVVKKENGDKYVDLSVHNEKPYGLDLLKEAVTKNPWLGCDYHIEPGESLKFAKVINKFIDTDDHFIFLGDFDARHHDPDFNLLKTFFGALKCRNVYLILGNNDSFPIRKYKELGIRAVTDTFEFENVVMTHFPVDVKAPKINIHGHLHGAGSPTQKGPKAYWHADPKRCVDVWRDDFTPLRLNDVLTNWKKMQKYESHYDGKQRLIGESVEIDDYGIPELKKYPLDTKQHVISAIKLFGHVDKEHEQELADNIIKKIEYYNLKDEVSVGDDNRFKKYFDDYFSEEVLDELRGELFEENVLISRDDIYYDFDKFESGQKNVLLITGFSGSGKSTLAEQLASKYKCDYFMIDSLEYYGERYMTLDDLKKGEPGCYEFLVKHPKIKEILDGDYSGKEFWNILCQYIPWLISWCKKRKNEKFIIEGLQLYETISGGDVPNTILKNPFIIKGTSGLKSAWRAGKRAGGKDLPAEFLKHIKWAFHDNKMIEGLKKALDEEYSESTEDVFEESLETFLTTNPLEKTVTLYHGSTGKYDVIKPLRLNVGTKLSNPRNSSFWGTDPHWCKAYALQKLISENGCEALLNTVMKTIYPKDKIKEDIICKESEKSSVEQTLRTGKIYLYSKTMEKKYLGIGHNTYYPEYSVDFDVKPDNVEELKYRDFKGISIKYISDEEYESFVEILEEIVKKNKKYGRGHILKYTDQERGEIKNKIKGYKESTEDIITEEADYNQKNMYPVYIILTDADSPMAKMIKRYTGQPYAHALISFNEDLEPAYSFGCTSIKPLKFGFISKGEEDPFRNEEKAAYVVYAMYVTKSQYVKIQKRIQWFIDNKDKLDYAWGGLAFFGLQIPKQFKNQYFCSQFVMQIIGEAVPLSKDPSLWSPGDIEYLTNISLVDKGDDLRKFDKNRFEKNLNYLKHHQFNRLKMALESSEAIFEEKVDSKFKFMDFKSPGAVSYLENGEKSYWKKYGKWHLKNSIGEIVVDSEKDALAGYILVDNKASGQEGFITPLMVIKQYRKNGLGNKLLEDAIRKYNAIDLVVLRSNTVAYNMYKKHGFVVIGKGNEKNSLYMKLRSKLTKDDTIIEESTEDDYFMEAEETLNPTTSHFLLQKIGKRVDTVLADPKNVRTFVNLVQNFINRNITKLTKSGPCDMIPFTDTDHEAFHKLFGFWYTIDPRANKTSPNEIRDIIDEYSKRAHIKCDFWKNNSSLMLFYFVIRYFTMKNDSKNLNTALAIYTLCNYPVMFHKYFPNGVMEPYMQYTIDNMTEKFIIKKSKHLFDALMTSIQASYKFHKGNFASATDKKVGDWINRIRNDQNSMMKKISNEYMKNYKAGNAARTSNEEYDGDTPIVDELENGTTVVQNLVQRVTLPIIEDGVDLVRAEAAAKMSQVSVSDCRYFLTLIITDSNADTIQKFIESLLFLYIYEGKKTERDIRSQYFLAWSASLFKKTNSKNKNINTINEILNFWAESTGLYKKFAGKTSRINYKKAIFFYLVLCIQKNV